MEKNSSDMSVEEIVEDMGAGWNLGNSLDAAAPENKETATIEEFETAWFNPRTTKELINTVIAAGFRAIRLPVTWTKKMDPSADYKIDPAWLDRVEEIVNYIYEEGIYVILDTHHEDEWLQPFQEKSKKAKELLGKIWSQVAKRFQDYDRRLIFETMNEIRLVGTEYEWNEGTKEAREYINEYNKVAVDTIRQAGGYNETRPIMIPTYGAKASGIALDDMVIPNNDPNIILTVHAYAPYFFCMVPEETNQWGTEEEKKELTDLFDELANVATKKHCPLIIGEFGTVNKENYEDRAKYCAFYVRECRKRNISCILWDNNENGLYEWNSFGNLDRSNLTWRYPKIIKNIIDNASV